MIWIIVSRFWLVWAGLIILAIMGVMETEAEKRKVRQLAYRKEQ